MKKLLLTLGVCFISVPVLAGPDIPWPLAFATAWQQNKTVTLKWVDPNHADHIIYISVGKNDVGYSEQCPIMTSVKEVDQATGQVLHEEKTLHCKDGYPDIYL